MFPGPDSFFPGQEFRFPGWETAFPRAELAFPRGVLAFPGRKLPIPGGILLFQRRATGRKSKKGARLGRSQNFHERQLMAERQVLLDSINIGCANQLRIAQASPPFWILALQQMPFAGASSRDFAGASDLEPFAHRLPGLNSFGSSHKIEFVDL